MAKLPDIDPIEDLSGLLPDDEDPEADEALVIQNFRKNSTLTHEQEKELITKFKQGDIQAYRKLRKAYQPGIRKLAVRNTAKSKDVSYTQIVNRIDSEFPRYARNYNPEVVPTFEKYFFSNANLHARNAASENALGAHIPRDHAAAVSKYKNALREARAANPYPTEDQIYTAYQRMTGQSLQQMRNIRDRYIIKTTIGDVSMSKEEDAPMLKDKFDFVGATEMPNYAMRSLQLEDLLQDAKNMFSPQEYQALYDHRVSRKTLSQSALDNMMSTTRLYSILQRWDRHVAARQTGGQFLPTTI